MAKRQACRVLVPRMILGRKCRPGDVIELTDNELEFLGKHGVVEPMPKAKKATVEDPDGPSV